jgi:hypothetical protein
MARGEKSKYTDKQKRQAEDAGQCARPPMGDCGSIHQLAFVRPIRCRT